MSSPSATADTIFTLPGARGAERKQMIAQTPTGYVDSGEPIDDLPPLIEPVADPTEGRRPPRRSFLAPVAPAFAPPAPDAPAMASEHSPPLDIPELVEPVAAPAEPASSPPARFAAPARWLATARGLWPSDHRSRLTLAAGGVVAIGLVVAVSYVARIGPFSPVRHYSVAGAPSDVAQRLAYFQRGAAAGDAAAELQLAILYAKGEGVAQDYTASATWFRAAASQGSPRAQYDLGVLYERGRGVKVDLTEAANWYLKAAQASYPLAEYNLAVCYTRGQGIRQDLPEAALWYRRAAGQGVVQAMVNLGTMYEKGEGVAVSPVDAYAWYLAAGRRDSQTAARRAEDLFNSLPQLDQIRAQALASDVAASIQDSAPERGEAATGSSDAKSAAPTH
jgi:hypothetical protein